MRRLAVLLPLLVACHAPRASRPRDVAPSAPPAEASAVARVEPAATPPPPPSADASTDAGYDLDADRERRLAVARAELGKTTSAVVADTFVVVGPPGPSFAPSVALLRSAMRGLLHERFSHAPAEAISVYLLPDAKSYEALCQKKYGTPCLAHFGFYQPEGRAMVMNIGLGLGTLTHELVHPLVEADFPDAPTWLNEGIASVFEQPILPRPGEIHGGTNWRLPRLRAGLAAGEIRLEQLIGLSDEAFRAEKEDLHYAAARYLCQWLDERGLLWTFFHRFREAHARDATGEKTFAEVVGATPADTHPVWARWVAAL